MDIAEYGSQRMNLRKLQTAVDSPHFRKIMLQFLYEFPAQKPFLKVQNLQSNSFWLKMTPPPFWDFSQKFTRFGEAIRPQGEL